ncbi:MAG: type I methionyl aminopeptidase [Actinomycetota bacterium]
MRRLRSNDPCWCGSGRKFKRCHGDRRALQRPVVALGTVSPVRPVPEAIVRPDYVGGVIGTPRGPQIQTGDSLERMRRAGRVAAEVLLRAGAAVRPGVTTDAVDAIAHDAYLDLGAYPSDLRYKGYPKSVCTSVNGVICHGIPDDRPLAEGDIVNIDVTAFIDGRHGDTSATFVVGDVGDAILGLVETTREATLRGCAAARTGAPLRAIAEAIEPFVRSRGYDVVAEYGGHGIGATFHAHPHVNHTVSRRDDEPLPRGLTLTVEPMVLSGGRGFHQADDGWTEHTDDAMPSAQFEHTIAVTDDGPEILTVTAAGDTAVGTLDRRAEVLSI